MPSFLNLGTLQQGNSVLISFPDGTLVEINGEQSTEHLCSILKTLRTKGGTPILLWDRTGFCNWYKRLEKERFSIASLNDNGSTLDLPQLMLILEGIDPAGARQRKRYRLSSAAQVK